MIALSFSTGPYRATFHFVDHARPPVGFMVTKLAEFVRLHSIPVDIEITADAVSAAYAGVMSAEFEGRHAIGGYEVTYGTMQEIGMGCIVSMGLDEWGGVRKGKGWWTDSDYIPSYRWGVSVSQTHHQTQPPVVYRYPDSGPVTHTHADSRRSPTGDTTPAYRRGAEPTGWIYELAEVMPGDVIQSA